MTWKELIREYLTGRRVIKKDGLIILVLTGILIFVIMLPTKDNNSSFIQQKKESQEEELKGKKQLETELKDFLERVEGVGKAEVLIYMNEETQNSYGLTNSTDNITGVIITAEGARDNQVKLVIIQMVRALYGLDYSNIEVFPMKRE